MAEVVRALAISKVTYYRWRKEYVGMRVEQAKRLKEIEKENARLRKAVADLTLDKRIPDRRLRELLSPERRRRCVVAVGERLGVSERRACRALRQHRSVQRRLPKVSSDEVALTAAITELATKYGRYGYRRITALLRQAGWSVNRKRVERIWRQEGLKVPARQPKRER